MGLDGVTDVSHKRRLVSALYETVQAGRNLRSQSKFQATRKIRFILRTEEKSTSEQIAALTRLLNAEAVTVEPKYQAPAGTPVGVTPLGEIFVAITAGDQVLERERLDKEVASIEQELRTVEAKLQNDGFVKRAPAPVVEDHRQRLNRLTAQLEKLRQARGGLS
jgi:valyl-tRNA synthetase